MFTSNIQLLLSGYVVSYSLWPHELQPVRIRCPPLSPRVCSDYVHCITDASQPSDSLPPLLFLPSLFPSIRVFSNEVTLHIRWPNCWSFSFSIRPFNEYSGLISFRMDWLDLLAVQGILKSLLQHHSSKASILEHSAFFTVQLSHPYMTTEKIIALTRWTFVGKVMSLLFITVYSFLSEEQASINFIFWWHYIFRHILCTYICFYFHI